MMVIWGCAGQLAFQLGDELELLPDLLEVGHRSPIDLVSPAASALSRREYALSLAFFRSSNRVSPLATSLMSFAFRRAPGRWPLTCRSTLGLAHPTLSAYCCKGDLVIQVCFI